MMRGNWLKAIEDHHFQYSGVCDIRDILDVGCSVGVSTRFLADRFPSAQVTVSFVHNVSDMSTVDNAKENVGFFLMIN